MTEEQPDPTGPGRRWGMLKRTHWAFPAATALALAFSVMPAQAIDAEAGFGPSATGCPVFWEVDGRPDGVAVDPPVGPFGTSQLHVTGFGFSIDGDDFTANIRVRDMQRRVAPGFTQSWWTVFFGDLYFRADYYLLADAFTFTWNKVGDFDPDRTALGKVVLGADGGISMTARMSELGLGKNFEAEQTRAAGGFKGWVAGGPATAAAWAIASGPERVPLVPCPGLSFSARLDPFIARKVIANGVTLPKVGGQPMELQLLEGGEWTTIGTGMSEDGGAYEVTATLNSGKATLRAVVATAAGVGTSAPMELNVP